MVPDPELDTPNMQLFFAPVSFTTKVWFPGVRPAEKVGLGGSVLYQPEALIDGTVIGFEALVAFRQSCGA